MKPIVFFISLLLAIMAATVCSAAPAFINLSTATVGANMATMVLKSSDTGRGYFTLLNGSSADCGTGAQVKAGKTAGGSAAPYFGSCPLLADLAVTYTIRNLRGGSPYTGCFTAENAIDNSPKATPVAADLSTPSATPFTSPGWSMVGGGGFSPGSAYFTSLQFAPDGVPYLVYVDANDSYKITVMSYGGGAWGQVGTAGFALATANSASLAFAPDGTPYLAYIDSGSFYATVKKYNGSNWVTVGTPLFEADTDSLSLAFGPNGDPYVSYIDAADSRATVMTYSAGVWSKLGASGLSSSGAWSTSLAISPDGVPHVAFADYDNGGSATVMKYNGSGWTLVGSPGFSAGTVTNCSLAVAPDGTLYLAYQDAGNSDKATVMTYGGSSWELMGSAGLSAGRAASISLALAPDGALYLAYQDGGTGYKATVMKSVSGSGWSPVGVAGFSVGTVNFTSLAISPDGTPFVAYGDDSYGSRATVMKLINLSPTISGTPTIATVGSPYSFTPTAMYAESFSITGIVPPGLGFSATTGTLSGTPTAAGSYSEIYITVTNSSGSAVLGPLSIEVINFPDTIIVTKPGNPDSTASFLFTFISIPTGSTFECSLAGAAYSVCTTPYSNSLASCATCRPETQMSFDVRAKNQAGNYDPTPDTYSWIINQTIGALGSSVVNGGVVQLKTADYTGDVNFSSGVVFTLKGGYDSSYSTSSGVSTVHGTFTISGGTVTIENIVIM